MTTATHPGEPVFELSGGAPCLDFANTLDERGRASPRERLRRYADLVAWSRQAGLVDAAAAAALVAQGERRPDEARQVLARGIVLREAIFRLFAAAAAEDRWAAADLAALNLALPRALEHLEVAPAAAGFGWRWRVADGDLDRMLWPVVRSAAELLTSPDLSRVRECAADTCRWLFLDQSRNQSRRWCDMAVCGNRAKARRHYRRQRS